MQKWLNYIGDKIDSRKVEDIAAWMDNQCRIRKIAYLSYGRSASMSNPRNDYTANKFGYNPTVNSASNTLCDCCRLSEHNLSNCMKFIILSHNEKWEYVKKNRLCFTCSRGNHRRNNCADEKCQFCNGQHHTLTQPC